MRRGWSGFGLIAAWGLLGGGCDAVLGLGDIEIPGSGGAGGAGAGGAAGGTGGIGTGGIGTGGTGGTVMDMCGDGMIGSTEGCDDGGADPGDGCDADCKPESGWVCTNEPGGPSVCAQTCGGGTLDAGEVCDDGDAEPLDGCDAQCQVEAGWECQQPGNDPEQPSVCATVCGDGIVVGAELCDDGNIVDTDGCKADCLAVSPEWECDMTGGAVSCAPICGDGLAVGAEACDDAGTVDGDGCSAACVVEHMCNNGVVDPMEECDGGPGCNVNCTLDPMSVCGKAFASPPGDVDDATGVRTSYYENDSNLVAVALADIPTQSCDVSFNFPVLHRYTTGNRPSIVTVEALDKMADGSATFANTVVWVYRDCPNKADLEGCDDDGGAGNRSLFTTGFIPAQTTLYIVLAGEGGGLDKGNYRLQVTERPVKLFYHESFGSPNMPGEYPLPASLTQDLVGDGGWGACVPGAGNPCFGVDLDSHSRGAFGFAAGATTTQTTATLGTPTVNLQSLQHAYGQFTYRFNDGVAADSGTVTAMDGANAGMSILFSGLSMLGRTAVDMPLSAAARIDFTYDDGAGAGAGKFFIDDIYIYGY